MTHLDQHCILVDCQHGFRKKRSCEAQLLITTHDLAIIMNNHSQVDAAVLDFAKAFDKVPHCYLLVKLEHYNLVDWTLYRDENPTDVILKFQ